MTLAAKKAVLAREPRRNPRIPRDRSLKQKFTTYLECDQGSRLCRLHILLAYFTRCGLSMLRSLDRKTSKAHDMAETKAFDGFEPIFGESTAELEEGEPFGVVFRRSFLFYVHPLDFSLLEIVASDFHSNTLKCVLTVMDIDNLRDETGIGGSWNDFVHYLLASLSTGDVKLILDGPENLRTERSVSLAKLIIRKSKGLPRISLPLNRLVNLPAKDATANISLALFNAYKSKHIDVVKGQEQLSRLEEMLSFEKDRNNNLQKQLDALSFSSKRKVPKVKGPEKVFHAYDNIGTKELVISEAEQTKANDTTVDKPQSKDAQRLRGSQRAVPAHRRAKARGVSLQENEDDDGR